MKQLNIFIILFFGINYTLIAQQTFVPDDNFEQTLIDLGHDNVLDDFVLTANINALTSIILEEQGISDLTGIEDFTALNYLFIRDNNISNLDIGNLTNLYQLNCESNNLSNLDLSNNMNLYVLLADNNQLTDIDLSNNLLLTNLDLGFNHLTELNVTDLLDLRSIECPGNQLETLDFSNNLEMKSLWCYGNQLEYLNVRNGNNSNVNFFNSEGNPNLRCIFVDDAVYSTANWENVDSSSTFVETQDDCDLLSLEGERLENEQFSLHPNPTNGVFQITTRQSNDIISLRLFSINGLLLMDKNIDSNSINLSGLSNGIYLIEITTDLGVITKKIIKQ